LGIFNIIKALGDRKAAIPNSKGSSEPWLIRKSYA
jgi:hypothetical protein